MESLTSDSMEGSCRPSKPKSTINKLLIFTTQFFMDYCAVRTFINFLLSFITADLTK